MRFSKLAAVVVLVAMASSCTAGSESGKPTPAPATSTSSGNDSADKLPTRPADLKLDSVDLCKLLTTDQMAQIGVPTAKLRESKLVDGKLSPTCFYSGDGGFGYQVGAVTFKGISYWLQGGGNVDVKVVKVADYGAVEFQLKGGTGFSCAVAIDVAEGQHLIVYYIPTTTKETDQSALCGKAEKAAGFALANLKTSK